MFKLPKFSGRLRSGALIVSAAAIGALTVGVSATPQAAQSAAAAPKQVVTGPVSVYWMNASTSSGFSLGGMSGGGKPSMSSMMNMMKGGTSHGLYMALGSNTAQTAPAADHLPAAVLGVGNDLPLYWKRPVTQNQPYQPYTPGERQDPQQPKGKILIFWGCGEHAPKNQPLVIDLSKITDATAAQGMMKQMAPSITLETVHPPSPDTYKSFGEWPNEKNNTGLNANSSLVGAHTVKGNYTPQIDFTLNASQDFLAPINVTGNEKDAQGAVPLTWAQIPGAKGFVATVIGGGQDTVVMWTSAASQTGWMGMAPDYLTPGDIDRLLAQNILLPGTATTCTVPAEVVNATGGSRGGGGSMFGITAYGGETNMAYPARPADPKVAWNIQWETKIRYKSSTGGILGQAMPGGGGNGGMMGAMFGGGGNDDSASDNSGSSSSSSSSSDDGKKKKKGSMFGNLVKQGIGSFIP